MAYGRKYGIRRKTNRRYRKRYSKSVATRLMKSVEYKHYDDNYLFGNISSLGSANTFLVENIGRGISPSQRIGNRIMVTGISVGYNAYYAGATSNAVRILMWYSPATDGDLALNQVISHLGDDLAVLAPLNRYHEAQFKMIHNQVVSLTTTYPYTADRFFKKVRIPVSYDDTGNVQSGGIVMAFVSDGDGTVAINFDSVVRVTFTDL